MMEPSVANCSEGDETRATSARKRLRLNAVLDRLTTQVEKKSDPESTHAGTRLSSSEPTLIAEVDSPDCHFTDPSPSDPFLNRRRSLSDGELQQVQQRFSTELNSPAPSLSNSPSGEKLNEEHPLDLSVRTDPLNSVCPLCGQVFWLNDRLAKHIASHHRGRRVDPASRTYVCHVCHRAFVRSDMLTRHMRLHTGVKPYTCRVCGQVFSRSDHLSTHQRTHTGEKPYTCPQCPYAACRRDMITRHMRTHARYGSILLEETNEQQHDEMYIYRLSGLHVSSPCIAHT